jgi:hypothetical protein
MDDNQHSKISTPMSLSSAFVDEAVKALEESGGDVDIAFCTEKSAVSTRHNRDSRRPSLGQYQLSAKALPSDSDYLPSYIDNEEKRVADEKIAADIELQYSPTLEREAGGYTGRHEKGKNQLIINKRAVMRYNKVSHCRSSCYFHFSVNRKKEDCHRCPQASVLTDVGTTSSRPYSST